MENWTRAHALALSITTVVGLLLERPALISIAAAGSFAALLALARPRRTVFGAANLITGLRLAATLTLPVLAWSARAAAVIAAAALALDGLDGWLARRRGTADDLGARFDMEADAFWVLATTVFLFSRLHLPAWVLIAGLWRYVYVLCLMLRPAPSGEAPRSRVGRWLYLAATGFLIAALVTPRSAALASAAGAATVISLSFLRSLIQTYLPSRLARSGAVAR